VDDLPLLLHAFVFLKKIAAASSLVCKARIAGVACNQKGLSFYLPQVDQYY